MSVVSNSMNKNSGSLIWTSKVCKVHGAESTPRFCRQSARVNGPCPSHGALLCKDSSVGWNELPLWIRDRCGTTCFLPPFRRLSF